MSALGTPTTTCPIVPSPHEDIHDYGAVGERDLGKEIEILGEILSHYFYIPHMSQMNWPGFEHWPPRWEASD
jgi:hypothetical protein